MPGPSGITEKLSLESFEATTEPTGSKKVKRQPKKELLRKLLLLKKLLRRSLLKCRKIQKTLKGECDVSKKKQEANLVANGMEDHVDFP